MAALTPNAEGVPYAGAIRKAFNNLKINDLDDL